MVYTLRFFFSKCSLFHNSNAFGSCIIHILYTGCAKIKKKSNAKRLKLEKMDFAFESRSWYRRISALHPSSSGRDVATDRATVQGILPNIRKHDPKQNKKGNKCDPSVAISGQLIKALGRHCNNRKYGDTTLGSAHAKEFLQT
jgi:hypothetical protein